MELEIGAILDGKVTGITKFGAFVALPGGRSGLVHISEVAYSYVSDVSEFLSVGQEVKVKLISVDENNRINLSIKQTLPPPPRQERPRRQGDRGPRPQGDRPQGEGRFNRGDRPERSERPARPQGEGRFNRSDRPERSERPQGERPQRSFNTQRTESRPAAPKEPQSFEDMMKRYMSESESRQSELNRGNRGNRNRRRGGGGRGGNSSYDF